MSKINAFSRVLNQKVKTRFFMDFQLMDNLNMTADKRMNSCYNSCYIFVIVYLFCIAYGFFTNIEECYPEQYHTVQPPWIILVKSCMIRLKLHVYKDGRTTPRNGLGPLFLWLKLWGYECDRMWYNIIYVYLYLEVIYYYFSPIF